MKKIILFLFISCSCFTFLNAQRLNWGVRGGLNISSLGDYEQVIGMYEDAELENKLGLYAGLFIQYSFTEKLGIESGLFYSQLGGKEKEHDYDESYKVTANPSYLQIPVTAFYKFSLPGNFKIYPALGIYAGYGLSGKMKSRGTIWNENIDSEIKYFKDFANRFDFGATIGLNLQYSKFIFGVNYDRGFLRVNKDKVVYGDNAFNSNFRCTLSYIFN
jgi:hypothetical protein